LYLKNIAILFKQDSLKSSSGGNMKRISCLASALLSFSLCASAGPSTSGGNGYAVICRSTSGGILSAELLDLYEATYRYHLNLLPSFGNLADDYARSTPGPNPRAELRRFLQILHFARPGQSVPALNDIGDTIAIPAGCGLEPAAFFSDSADRVLVDPQIWEALNSLNQAALVSHELLYHEERECISAHIENAGSANEHSADPRCQKTSEATRRLVAEDYSERIDQ
jgi:hypothetical protein